MHEMALVTKPMFCALLGAVLDARPRKRFQGHCRVAYQRNLGAATGLICLFHTVSNPRVF